MSPESPFLWVIERSWAARGNAHLPSPGLVSPGLLGLQDRQPQTWVQKDQPIGRVSRRESRVWPPTECSSPEVDFSFQHALSGWPLSLHSSKVSQTHSQGGSDKRFMYLASCRSSVSLHLFTFRFDHESNWVICPGIFPLGGRGLRDSWEG